MHIDHYFIFSFDIKQPESRCRYKDKISSGESSSVFLAPSAFSNAGAHLGQPETLRQVTHIEGYINGDLSRISHEDVNLRAGIRDAVRLTSS